MTNMSTADIGGGERAVSRHGMTINLEKTDVLHIGHQRGNLDIELEGKKLTQEDNFVYPVGAVCGDGKTEREGHSQE